MKKFATIAPFIVAIVITSLSASAARPVETMTGEEPIRLTLDLNRPVLPEKDILPLAWEDCDRDSLADNVIPKREIVKGPPFVVMFEFHTAFEVVLVARWYYTTIDGRTVTQVVYLDQNKNPVQDPRINCAELR
jgi:hypothetical protein